ncbi:MAG: cell envelope biogenesis protein TolA [Hyalangium sp.]|uniref:cell envelope biogenesis protein TolA n=1 Tax=Hyalangium sp. TaxID=2028555 RepID=UPI00389B1D34
MLVALILVSIGFAVTLGMLLFGSNQAAVSTPSARKELDDGSKARARAESELERKQKEFDEQRTQLQDLKEQLKQAKRKLYEQKESEKGDRDLVKARTETERQASVQLEMVRGELSQALAEIERLRSEQGGGARPRRAPAPSAPAAPSAPSAPAAQPEASSAAATGQISAPAHEGERVVTATVQVTPAAEPASEKDKGPRRYRELNDADREKMERLEHSANKERTRASEMERELRRLKGQRETQQRIFNATKSELDLQKDKFKALEKRLNRTLLERDLLRRAIKDLEKKTGMMADRTELTPDEVAASDQRTEEAARERAAAEAQRTAAQAQAEAAAAKPAESTEAPAASSEAPASTSGEADKSSSPSA